MMTNSILVTHIKTYKLSRYAYCMCLFSSATVFVYKWSFIKLTLRRLQKKRRRRKVVRGGVGEWEGEGEGSERGEKRDRREEKKMRK